MDPDFLTFARYNDEILAQEIAALLRAEGITVQLEDTVGFFDPTFANNPLQREVRIKMHPRDFKQADERLLSYYEKNLNDLEADYPLLSFNNEELYEILKKPDEWGRFDYVLAKKLLQERGLSIEDEALNAFKSDRNEVLMQPYQIASFTLILFYLAAIFFPIIAICIGWFVVQSTFTSPDGTVTKRYDKQDQQHGWVIISLSLAMLILVMMGKQSAVAFIRGIVGW